MLIRINRELTINTATIVTMRRRFDDQGKCYQVRILTPSGYDFTTETTAEAQGLSDIMDKIEFRGTAQNNPVPR